ncbi:MAG: hypothetical protein QOF77_886 [Solirubrobacteraceae bacterium]|nr:hypothetical protein [Solirubrobacteraceae bacterium]
MGSGRGRECRRPGAVRRGRGPGLGASSRRPLGGRHHGRRRHGRRGIRGRDARRGGRAPGRTGGGDSGRTVVHSAGRPRLAVELPLGGLEAAGELGAVLAAVEVAVEPRRVRGRRPPGGAPAEEEGHRRAAEAQPCQPAQPASERGVLALDRGEGRLPDLLGGGRVEASGGGHRLELGQSLLDRRARGVGTGDPAHVGGDLGGQPRRRPPRDRRHRGSARSVGGRFLHARPG